MVVGSGGVVRQIIERIEDEPSGQVDPEPDDEDDRLSQATALSLTPPEGTTHVVAKAKCARVVRFHLLLLDPPPRELPAIPRLRSYRFRHPPAPVTPKPSPPHPTPTRERRMSATMRFSQAKSQRPVFPHMAAAPIRPPSLNRGISPVSPDTATGPPEVTPEPSSGPAESEAESLIFDSTSSSQR